MDDLSLGAMLERSTEDPPSSFVNEILANTEKSTDTTSLVDSHLESSPIESRHGNRRRNLAVATIAAALILVVVVGVAISRVNSKRSLDVAGTGTRVVEGVASEEFAGAAAFGDDLAILVFKRDVKPSSSLVRRSPDGTLTELPPLPQQGVFRIGSAGDTVLVGGVACGKEYQCSDGELVVYQLSRGSEKWEQVYSGSEVVNSEIEMSVSVGPAEFAEFSLGDTGVYVGENGLVSDDLPKPSGEAFKDLRYSYSCNLGDRVVVLPAIPDLDPGPGDASVQFGSQTTRANGSVWELRFDSLDKGWIEVADAPREITNISARTECADSQMVIHNDDVKWTYDAVTRGWTTGPSTYRELTDSQVFGANQPGEIAVSPNGESVFSIGGRLLERTRDGDWGATEVAADRVYATAVDVIAITLPAGASTTFTKLSTADGDQAMLPWDQLDFQGALIDVRLSDCTDGDCPLGVVTLSGAVSVPDGVNKTPIPNTQVAITDETRLFGCGPTDARVPITLQDLLESKTEAIGEMPTYVWVADGLDVDSASLVQATQVVSGSCG